MRHPFLFAAHWARSLSLVIAGIALLGADSVSAETRPNILLVVVDDLGWAGVGFHNKEMPTPNLNKLAGEGIELSRFYVYPVCSPTRVGLLTGQMPRRFGVPYVGAGVAIGLWASYRVLYVWQ